MTNEDDKLVSPSGQPIYRYTDGEKEWESPQGEMCLVEISDHIERHIGKIDSVFHEILSDTVHVDIHHVKPTEQRPYHTLVTSGMSDLPMTVPEESGSGAYMELMATLPADWQISDRAFEEERWYWPVRQLKYLARFPHKYSTWFGWGHTIPNGDPPDAFADNTQLCGVIILPSIIVPDDFYSLTIDESKTIEFFSILPLYGEELSFKLNMGSDALLDKFDKHDIDDAIDPVRKNVCKKRFGLF